MKLQQPTVKAEPRPRPKDSVILEASLPRHYGFHHQHREPEVAVAMRIRMPEQVKQAIALRDRDIFFCAADR